VRKNLTGPRIRLNTHPWQCVVTRSANPSAISEREQPTRRVLQRAGQAMAWCAINLGVRSVSDSEERFYEHSQ